MDLLTPQIIAELVSAWRESLADDPSQRHEEGGYIVLDSDQTLGVERWMRGEKSRILPPPLDANRWYNGKVVVAAFHTHPNPVIDEVGREWEQAPSSSDRRWHRRQKLGVLVISRELVY
jgi:hypothetical protein